MGTGHRQVPRNKSVTAKRIRGHLVHFATVAGAQHNHYLGLLHLPKGSDMSGVRCAVAHSPDALQEMTKEWGSHTKLELNEHHLAIAGIAGLVTTRSVVVCHSKGAVSRHVGSQLGEATTLRPAEAAAG